MSKYAYLPLTLLANGQSVMPQTFQLPVVVTKLYRHNFLSFDVWEKVYPPEKGFFWGVIKNGACFFLGGGGETKSHNF